MALLLPCFTVGERGKKGLPFRPAVTIDRQEARGFERGRRGKRRPRLAFLFSSLRLRDRRHSRRPHSTYLFLCSPHSPPPPLEPAPIARHPALAPCRRASTENKHASEAGAKERLIFAVVETSTFFSCARQWPTSRRARLSTSPTWSRRSRRKVSTSPMTHGVGFRARQ